MAQSAQIAAAAGDTTRARADYQRALDLAPHALASDHPTLQRVRDGLAELDARQR